MPTTTFAPARDPATSPSQHSLTFSPVNIVDQTARQRGAPQQRLPPLSPTHHQVPRSSSPRHHAAARSPSHRNDSSSPISYRTLSRHNSTSLWSTSSQAVEDHLTLPSIWETDDIGLSSTVNLPGLDTPFFTPFAAHQEAYETLPRDDDPPFSSSSAASAPGIPLHWDTSLDNIYDLDFPTSGSRAAVGPFAAPPSSRTAAVQATGGPAVPTASSRSGTHFAPHTNYSPTSLSSDEDLFGDDLFGDDHNPDTAQTSFSDIMPASRKRSAPGGIAMPPITKRPRPSFPDKHAQTNRQPTTLIEQDDDCFEDPPSVGDLPGQDDLPTIDLTEANEVPEDLLKPEEDKRVKISAFQCVICMDDATSLTVTHCGHLYCAQCLHSSLNVEATKGKCPMCRSKIELKPRKDYTSKTKGFWPLELKLMKVTKKGKQKAVAAQ